MVLTLGEDSTLRRSTAECRELEGGFAQKGQNAGIRFEAGKVG